MNSSIAIFQRSSTKLTYSGCAHYRRYAPASSNFIVIAWEKATLGTDLPEALEFTHPFNPRQRLRGRAEVRFGRRAAITPQRKRYLQVPAAIHLKVAG